MHKNNSQAFRVVCLENLDHKFHGAVILKDKSAKTHRYEGTQYTMFAIEKSVISKTIA